MLEEPRYQTAAEESVASAQAAGLVFVSDDTKGINRKPRGKVFQYFLPSGARLKDRAELARIRKLAIPPAWTDVWICPSPNGHIQATGRDARGRKQYRYHPDWSRIRDEAKYDRLLTFAHALPRIRKVVQEHMAERGLGRNKVLSTVVHLLLTRYGAPWPGSRGWSSKRAFDISRMRWTVSSVNRSPRSSALRSSLCR
jgi:DNA topoisomerase I